MSLGVFHALALVALLSLLACGTAPPPSAASPVLGERVQIHLPSDEGALVALPLEGARATVIDVFGPTCEPCREKVPALLARRGELRGVGARVVLVAVLADSETTADAREALQSWGVEGASFLVDRGDLLSREAAVEGLPASLVLSPAGEVRWVADVTSSAEDVVAAARAVATDG